MVEGISVERKPFLSSPPHSPLQSVGTRRLIAATCWHTLRYTTLRSGDGQFQRGGNRGTTAIGHLERVAGR
jgi:hypothetical protein